ncbi:hypothetical protein L7F22_007289 [Adiantum nelumboides]|nr:hypothetical protein [Adiantum nelumboides]
MLRATDDIPLNFAFTGKGNDSNPVRSRSRSAPAVQASNCTRTGAPRRAPSTRASASATSSMSSATSTTDTLNESSFVEGTIAAFKGRTIHTYREFERAREKGMYALADPLCFRLGGSGGGHAPDIITVCGESNVLPSSTNPTRPYAKNTLDEHLDMLMVCHHLSKNIAEDVAFADSRIRAETVAAEDVLQDQGAISIISSDSQAMGRIGEVVSRTWRTAAKMRQVRGPWMATLQETTTTGSSDTLRNTPSTLRSETDELNADLNKAECSLPTHSAIVHGMSHLIGSVEEGKLADLVLYKPSNFGTKPEMIIKGGQIAWAQMGTPMHRFQRCSPFMADPCTELSQARHHSTAIAFVSGVSISTRTIAEYGLRKRVEAVVGCRKVTKSDMKLNSALPKLTVDPESYDVLADGELCTVPAATALPLTQAAHLF